MNPLIGFALAHAEQAPLDHLEAVGLEIGQEEEQAIFWCRQGAVLVDAKLTGGAGLPIEAPRGHMCLKCRLKGRDELLKFVEGQAGQIQELRRAVLHVGEL
jgi:hypothetical protein